MSVVRATTARTDGGGQEVGRSGRGIEKGSMGGGALLARAPLSWAVWLAEGWVTVFFLLLS